MYRGLTLRSRDRQAPSVMRDILSDIFDYCSITSYRGITISLHSLDKTDEIARARLDKSPSKGNENAKGGEISEASTASGELK